MGVFVVYKNQRLVAEFSNRDDALYHCNSMQRVEAQLKIYRNNWRVVYEEREKDVRNVRN